MTDTGQVPAEGQPESAGTVEQPGVSAPGAYAYLSETTAEDEDLLLLPGAQSAWGNEVAPPPPEPVVEAVHEPGPHEMSGRDSGSVDLSAVRLPNPTPSSASVPPRRPLHLGPPIPDTSASPVRSLADRGPAGAPVRHPGPPTTGPEYLDVPPQGAPPWGAQAVAQTQVSAGAPAAETVVPAPAPTLEHTAGHDPEPPGAAQALVARVATEAVAATAPQPAYDTEAGVSGAPDAGEGAAGVAAAPGTGDGVTGDAAAAEVPAASVEEAGATVAPVDGDGAAAEGVAEAEGADVGAGTAAEGADADAPAVAGAARTTEGAAAEGEPVADAGAVTGEAEAPEVAPGDEAGQVPDATVVAGAGAGQEVTQAAVVAGADPEAPEADGGQVPGEAVAADAVQQVPGAATTADATHHEAERTPEVGQSPDPAHASEEGAGNAVAETAPTPAVTVAAAPHAAEGTDPEAPQAADGAVDPESVPPTGAAAPETPQASEQDADTAPVAPQADAAEATEATEVPAAPAPDAAVALSDGAVPAAAVAAAEATAPGAPAPAEAPVAGADVAAAEGVVPGAAPVAEPTVPGASVPPAEPTAPAASVLPAEPTVPGAPVPAAEPTAAGAPVPAAEAEVAAAEAPPVAIAPEAAAPTPEAATPEAVTPVFETTAPTPETAVPTPDAPEAAPHTPEVAPHTPEVAPHTPEAVPFPPAAGTTTAPHFAEGSAPPAPEAPLAETPLAVSAEQPSPRAAEAGHAPQGQSALPTPDGQPAPDTRPPAAPQPTGDVQPSQGPQQMPTPVTTPAQDASPAQRPEQDTQSPGAEAAETAETAVVVEAPDVQQAPASAPEDAAPEHAEPAPAHAPDAVSAQAAGPAPDEAAAALLPSTIPSGPGQDHAHQPLNQFVPVEGSVPTAPHLAPTPPHPVALPPEGPATVPAPRVAEPDPDVVQNAEDLDTRAADQEESKAAVEETAQSTGPAAPAYDEAEREAVLKVMRERRDIRNGFRSDPIPHEVLLRVLEAAHTAPSVGHSQPWDFVVIRSAETRRTMHELATRQREAYAKSLPKGRAKQFKELKIEAILDTPVNIVVTADPTRGGRHTLGRHTQPQMAPYSSALAVENLWLAARAEGLGVGWVSFFDEREMVRALGLPEHLEVVAYLCVGYVDEFPDEPELLQAGWSKRRPLSWVVHEETYGRRALPGEEPHDLLAETVAQIRPLDAKALGEAWERQKRMTKPAGALGMLEIISAQLSGLSRQCPPPIPEPAAVAIFAGDHGVHAQGVTPWPQEVTAQMVANFLGGGAVCNAFATQVGAEVCVVDVGVAADLPATPGLLPRKVRAGTSDMTTGPAMTREEAKQAIEVGIETARDLVAAGNKALLTGEMGIANTTASAALISVFTGADPAEVTGRGTGINDETLARKTEVVRRALDVHQPDPADPIGVLAAIGGFEHAAMVGLLLGGASLRTPVILDGVSAGAAALVARAIAPEVLAACIAGHRSAEPGHVAALNKLGLRPLVDLDLRLGEGTGALLALPLVQSTARAMHEVATFDSAGVTEK
ncbi:nicotinate-nucleotide--dimethylbenzimidazole phosphoribosyltransferase [Streptomyces griseus]|uniref:nicotinate-nucleotide--dimethylbenzimidazole phosphoribosyltransferase n=1 Tax=Streptomyces griseus TaxID=1911 RepID=UPI00068C7322|nr:nicotinate-nucleotide--dimethylbenzimidazole phosphoribosyltransferase [Streptomyces griseus]